jgi:DNA-binding transcriptional MocR family regulator
MILPHLDRRAGTPLHQQIASQVRRLVDDGTLAAGSALPSSRSLASRLGVNRSTVCQAYQELWALGYVDSRAGSYTRVRARARLADGAGRAGRGMIDWEEASAPAAAALFERASSYQAEQCGDGVVNLSRLDMDPRLFPLDELRRCLSWVLSRDGRRLLRYGDRQGEPALREVIAERARTHGMAVSADQVLVTNGSQQAIDLVLRLLAPPGSGVALEVPTYSAVIPLLAGLSLEPLGVPMADDGLDLEQLERLLERRRPRLLYTIPNFQNPTGITTDQAHREALLEVCRRHRLPLVEDGFEEEMKYRGGVTLPIKSMDSGQVVVYLGTFSKILFPGVRTGWVIADPECIRRLTALKRFSDLSSSGVLQAAMAELCRQGHYEVHVRRMHKVYRRRMEVAQAALRRHLPGEAVTWTEPVGGYLVWVRFRGEGAFGDRFARCCDRHRVAVSPGRDFFPGTSRQTCFRISISMLDEAAIEDGVARLGRAVRETVSAGEGP